MAGLGKLVKQAEKMKRGIEALQAQLDAKEIEVTSGGGAVKVRISGSGRFLGLTLDPEFLKDKRKFYEFLRRNREYATYEIASHTKRPRYTTTVVDGKQV